MGTRAYRVVADPRAPISSPAPMLLNGGESDHTTSLPVPRLPQLQAQAAFAPGRVRAVA